MRKVIVVEDETLVRRGIVQAVDWASVGCEVVGEAANGEQGLSVIREMQPDLIVTDIKMPVLGGLEMVQRLREEGNGAQVIFLTAYSDFTYAQSALRLGAADYLLKPFHDGELEAVVRRLESASPIENDRQPEEPVNGYAAEAARYIEAHYSEPDLTIGDIAKALGISEGHLSHLFKNETGQTLGTHLTQTRIRAAMELLRDFHNKVYEVAEMAGYRDIAHFSSTFKRIVGVTPSEYQRSAGNGE